MKVLINKENPEMRITAPEIEIKSTAQYGRYFRVPRLVDYLWETDWTLVEEPKFKIGDKINLIGRENAEYNILTITSISNEEQCYVCHQGSVIDFEEQDQWTLVVEEPTERIKGNLEEIPSNVDLEKEIFEWLHSIAGYNNVQIPVTFDDIENTARHFYELGLNARKNARKEE